MSEKISDFPICEKCSQKILLKSASVENSSYGICPSCNRNLCDSCYDGGIAAGIIYPECAECNDVFLLSQNFKKN